MHDVAQQLLQLFFLPGQTRAVLAHFQTRHRHAARVGGLARREQDLGVQEDVNAFLDGRHVGAFGHRHAAVFQQQFCLIAADFVLRGAGQRDVAGHAPRALAGEIFAAD